MSTRNALAKKRQDRAKAVNTAPGGGPGQRQRTRGKTVKTITNNVLPQRRRTPTKSAKGTLAATSDLQGFSSLERVSFRSQLSGEVLSFLKNEGFECVPTTEAVVELVASLGDYREEGAALFPQVFICNNADQMASRLGAQRIVIHIGEGPRGIETIGAALKKCAALATGGWSIFVERTQEKFRYGLFSGLSEPLALTSREIILSAPDPQFPIVFVSQVKSHVVEIIGASGKRLQCHLSASDTLHETPTRAISELVSAITKSIAADHKEQVAGCMYRLIARALLASHGALITVTSKNKTAIPQALKDGVHMSPPFSYLERVVKHKRTRDALTMSDLVAAESLITGMIASDGITIFREDASVLGYRAFVNAPQNPDAISVTGGARTRAYNALCRLVDDGGLLAVFFRSQDGHVKFKGKT